MATAHKILKDRSLGQMRAKTRSATKGPLLSVSKPGQIQAVEDAAEPDTLLLKRILSGRIGNLPPVSSKTVRVFLSSTFSGSYHYVTSRPFVVLHFPLRQAKNTARKVHHRSRFIWCCAFGGKKCSRYSYVKIVCSGLQSRF